MSERKFNDNSVPVLALGYRFQWEPAQDCHVLLYPEGMVKLNPAAAEILKRQPGCRGLRWGKRVEPDLAFVLEVEWDQIEDHFGFRETDDYKSFGALFRDFLSKPPEVVHFHPAD